jgi:hypothetical protein
MDDGDNGDIATEGDQVGEEEQCEECGPQVWKVGESHQHKLGHQPCSVLWLLLWSLRGEDRARRIAQYRDTDEVDESSLVCKQNIDTWK